MNPVESGASDLEKKKAGVNFFRGIENAHSDKASAEVGSHNNAPRVPIDLSPLSVESSQAERHDVESKVNHPASSPPPVSPDPAITAQSSQQADDAANDPAVPQQSSLGRAPSAAADSDSIEAEWIDLARAVLSESAGDPYKKQLNVSLLQQEYLKKRHGFSLKVDS